MYLQRHAWLWNEHPALGGASTWWPGTPLRCTKGLPHPCPLRGTRPECRPGPKPTLLHWPRATTFFWLRGDTCRHASPSFSPYSPATLKLTLAPWHITTYDALGSANTHTSHRDGDVYAAIPHTTRLFPHSLSLLLPLSLFLLPSPCSFSPLSYPSSFPPFLHAQDWESCLGPL